MKREPNLFSFRVGGLRNTRVLAAATMAAGLLLSGCLQPLHKQAGALSAAATPVVDQATAAYRNANQLHDQRVDYEAVTAFDQTDPVYKPKETPILLSEKDIDVRLAVLKAFQLYVADVVAITDGTSSPALDQASTSAGHAVTSLGNNLAPVIEGQPAASSSATSSTDAAASTPAISVATGNAISTAANALGQFLVYRTVRQGLPAVIQKMDPNVEVLCKLLEKDVDLLQSQERRDYDYILNHQTLFLREKPNMDPDVRRREIMQLPEIVRKQRAADEQLTDLKGALVTLALTHHALAAEAQGNNPESLKGKLGDLAAAGSNLGKFYSSLPTQ